jgi:hypothetical protein
MAISQKSKPWQPFVHNQIACKWVVHQHMAQNGPRMYFIGFHPSLFAVIYIFWDILGLTHNKELRLLYHWAWLTHDMANKVN